MPKDKQKKETVKKQESPTPTSNVSVNDKTVFIGKKPVMNYVIACMTRLNSGSDKVVVKARGRSICRAVDTVELLRRVFLKNLQLQSIALGTEEVTRDEGRMSKVSAIEITIAKP
jgi:DNA-binding protein